MPHPSGFRGALGTSGTIVSLSAGGIPMSRRSPGFVAWALAGALLPGSALAAIHDVTTPCGGKAGAVGNRTQDDTPAIQCHIDAAAAAHGGTVYLPAGQYRILGTLHVSGDGITIQGDGHASVLRANPADHLMIAIDGRRDIVIRDLALLEGPLERLPDQRSSSVSVGIAIKGTSDDVLIENVRTRGFARGIQRGTSSDVTTNLTMRDVWVEQAGGWGIELFNVQGFWLHNVRTRNNGAEGIKIGTGSRDWEIHGGRSWDNGAAGISVHAGGFHWLIVGTRLDGNAGGGLLIKASATTTSLDNPISEGTVMGVISENNAKGIDFFSGSPLDPLPNHITVVGGVFKGNAYNGIYLDGRNISLIGVVVKNNLQDGIFVRDRSFDVSIIDPQISANGDGVSERAGLRIHGDRVRVSGAQINGVYYPVAVDDRAGAPLQKHSIVIGPDASDVVIESSVLRNSIGAEVSGSLDGTTIRDTVGWTTHTSGTATVPAGATSVRVPHGLSMAPTAQSLSVTPLSAWGNVQAFWVDSVNAENFQIRVTRGAGSATAVAFRWDADVGAP